MSPGNVTLIGRVILVSCGIARRLHHHPMIVEPLTSMNSFFRRSATVKSSHSPLRQNLRQKATLRLSKPTLQISADIRFKLMTTGANGGEEQSLPFRHVASSIAAKNGHWTLSCNPRVRLALTCFLAALVLLQNCITLKNFRALPLSSTSFTNSSLDSQAHPPTYYPRSIVWLVETGRVASHLLDDYRVYVAEEEKEDISASEDDIDESLASSDDTIYEAAQECVFHIWQTSQHPACNSFHELVSSYSEELHYLASGSMARVFEYRNSNKMSGEKDDSGVVLKTLRFPHREVEDWTLNNVRTDALVSERLTSSPYIMNSYGYCGTSALAPFASGGNLMQLVREARIDGGDLDPIDKLKLAVQTANGLAAVHGVGQNSDGIRSSIQFAHNDLHWKQWIYFDGIMQLNDFNFGKFLKHDLNHDNATCMETSSMYTNQWRAPEDLAQLFGLQPAFHMEKADIYSFGFVLSQILFRNEGGPKLEYKEFKRGYRPPIPPAVRKNENPAVQTLVTAIDACCALNPQERPTSTELVAFLSETLQAVIGSNVTIESLKFDPEDLIKRSSAKHVLYSE